MFEDFIKNGQVLLPEEWNKRREGLQKQLFIWKVTIQQWKVLHNHEGEHAKKGFWKKCLYTVLQNSTFELPWL